MQSKNVVELPFKLFQKRNTPILSPGMKGRWDDEVVVDPRIIEFGGMYYNYYICQLFLTYVVRHQKSQISHFVTVGFKEEGAKGAQVILDRKG
jgi:hypothetical protein